MNSKVACVLFFTFVIEFYRVEAIKCYMCDSSKSGQGSCSSSDPAVLKKYEIDCDLANENYVYCIKGYDAGDVIRGCTRDRGGLINSCKSGNGVAMCICTTPLCNKGPVTSSGDPDMNPVVPKISSSDDRAIRTSSAEKSSNCLIGYLMTFIAFAAIRL